MRFSALLFSLIFAASALAQLPPYQRNLFTTNTPAAADALAEEFGGGLVSVTVATLPAAPTTGQSVWATDVVTSFGLGDRVMYDGSNWRTTERVIATADIPTFMRNAWARAFNSQTALSTIWFSREVAKQAEIGFPSTHTTFGSGFHDLFEPSFGAGSFISIGVGVVGGGVSSRSAQAYVQAGGFFGSYGGLAVNVLSTDADAYWVSFGFTASTTTNYPATGAFFLYDRYNTNSHGITGTGTNNWLAVTCNSSSYTVTDTTITPGTDVTAPNRLAVILTSTNCLFYINGTLRATHTTTLPTVPISLYSWSTKLVRVHGSVNRTVYQLTPSIHLRQAANRTF